MPFIRDDGYDWPYDDQYDDQSDDEYYYGQSDDEYYSDDWDYEYYESTIEVIPQEDPFNRNRRLINIDLGPAVSAAAELGREVHIIVEEPVEGDESVAVPWELLDGWFYNVGDSYVISLLVEDRADFDLGAVLMLHHYYNIRRNIRHSFSFLFTIEPLLIVLLD